MNIGFAMVAVQVGMRLMGKFEEVAKDGILTDEEALGLVQDALHAYEEVSGKEIKIRLSALTD